MPEDHKQPPQNVKEVGIHIGYLREDISDVKALLENHIALVTTTVGVAGRYRIDFDLTWSTPSGVVEYEWRMRIMKNAETLYNSAVAACRTAWGSRSRSISLVSDLAKNDVIAGAVSSGNGTGTNTIHTDAAIITVQRVG